jgi:hypothetical protein
MKIFGSKPNATAKTPVPSRNIAHASRKMIAGL